MNIERIEYNVLILSLELYLPDFNN